MIVNVVFNLTLNLADGRRLKIAVFEALLLSVKLEKICKLQYACKSINSPPDKNFVLLDKIWQKVNKKAFKKNQES